MNILVNMTIDATVGFQKCCSLQGDPSSSGVRPPLSSVLHMDLNSVQLMSPGPCLGSGSCQGVCVVGEGRWERKEKGREREERGGWMGSRSMQSLEVKNKKAKGMCVCVTVK